MVFLHIEREPDVRPPLNLKKNLDVLITDGISKIRQQHARTFNYPIISLAGDEDTVSD